MNRYADLLHLVLNNSSRTLWLGGALLLAACACLPYPRIYIELDAMLPESSEITQTIRLSQKLFGPSDYVVIGLTHESGQALDAKGAQQLARVQSALLALPGVRPADLISMLSDRAKVVEGDGGDVRIIPILRDANDWKGATERARKSSVYRSLLSEDGRASLLLLRIREPKEGKLAFFENLQAKLDAGSDPAFTLVVGGQPTVFAALERYTQNIFLVLPFTLLLIGLIHFEAFRSMQGLVFPLLTAIVSAAIATACMRLCGIRLDGFNSSAPLVIVALTAGHAVQMLKRYNEEFVVLAGSLLPGTVEWRAASRKAIEQSFLSIAPVMVAASLVAACSFASLAIFDTPVIRFFGVYAAVRIMAGLVVELIFIPALRLRVVPKSLPHVESRLTVWDRIVDLCAGLCVPALRRRTILFSLSLLAVFSVLATQVKVDNSVEEYFARFTDIRKSERVLNERFAGSSVLYLLFKGAGENAIATAETANLMRRIEAWLLAKPEIGTAVSYADAAAEVGCGFDTPYCAAGALPWTDQALRQFHFVYESGAGNGVLDEFVTPERDAALIRVLSKTDSSLFIDHLFRDLRAEFGAQVPQGVSLMLGGTGATTLALNQKFIEVKLANIVQMLSIASLIAALLFRSVLMGLLVAVPLLASTLFAFAAMTVLNITLNVATIFIAAVSVGIGADYAIYFGTRLRDFLRMYPDDEALATHMAFRTAGKAALFVACAVGGGYFGLVASIGYNVHLWLGVLVSASMLASIAASLTLFPALLLTLRPAAIFARRGSLETVPCSK